MIQKSTLVALCMFTACFSAKTAEVELQTRMLRTGSQTLRRRLVLDGAAAIIPPGENLQAQAKIDNATKSEPRPNPVTEPLQTPPTDIKDGASLGGEDTKLSNVEIKKQVPVAFYYPRQKSDQKKVKNATEAGPKDIMLRTVQILVGDYAGRQARIVAVSGLQDRTTTDNTNVDLELVGGDRNGEPITIKNYDIKNIRLDDIKTIVKVAGYFGSGLCIGAGIAGLVCVAVVEFPKWFTNLFNKGIDGTHVLFGVSACLLVVGFFLLWRTCRYSNGMNFGWC